MIVLVEDKKKAEAKLDVMDFDYEFSVALIHYNPLPNLPKVLQD